MSFNVYPNPVKGNTINVQFIDQPVGLYEVKLINITGRVVYTEKISVSSNNMLQPLKTTTLQKGMYQLEIKNADNSTQVQKIIVQ